MNNYDPHKIELKWQKIWEEKKNLYHGKDFDNKPKHYHLVEFPYPSGYGLHVGHCMGYGASDAYTRMKRMQGFNVMFPMGWDAFGLPTENFAIKTGRKPAEVTKENSDNFRKQMKSLGYSFDWDREVNTTDPDYYKWTQWIFLQFYQHAIVDGQLIEVADDDTTTPRLAYQAEMPINWCPSCKIGLANEEVVDGKCERCGTEVVKKMQKQWMLRITAYADRLIKDLDTVEYLNKIKTQQINWIGKSTGTNIAFRIQNTDNSIEVFTTRADTLFGCTYVVLAPEHLLVDSLKSKVKNLKEVDDYIAKAKKKSDMERTELQKEKAGVKLEGIKAINPINNEEVDIYVADYVLANYGTGAVMAVPAHDDRDFEFAQKYNIPIKQVIAPAFFTKDGADKIRDDKETVKRRGIVAIVKHWKEDKIFCLNWEKFNWKSFVLGGVEEGETSEEAAAREVKEETGYQNVKSVRRIGFETHSHFFAGHKDINRYGINDCFIVELKDGERSQPDDEFYTGSWVDDDKISDFINLKNNAYFWDIYKHGEKAFTDYGVLINSCEFDGLTSDEAKKKITEKLQTNGDGDFTINFKLRDWIFSRQHYWGEPIPIIHCEKCGKVPLSEKDLPLTLPDVENYQPTNTGESPLAAITDWVNVKCPKCGGNAKRETDTMPNWAGSSWYFLRYCDPKNQAQFAEEGKLKYWMPVDIYNGGMEHTTLHLLYSRFWHKFLYDLKLVPTLEPYQKRIAHGIILGPDGRKMSKSFGNVINPDDIIEKYGADTTRAYIMFIGPYDAESAWNMAGVAGVSRFLNRVYNNSSLALERVSDSKELLIKLNQTVKGVTDDLESFRLNTVVAKLMELNNFIEKEGKISWGSYATFLQLLFPVAPHLSSELWQNIFPVGGDNQVEQSPWPKPDSKYLIADQIEIVVQINGKVRDKLMVNADIPDDELKQAALESEKVQENIAGKEVIKTIVVPKKLVSIVIK